MTDAVIVSDRDLARQSRVGNFDGTSWLRANRIAAMDSAVPAQTTPEAELRELPVFEPPRLNSPRIQNFLTEQEFEGVVLSVDEAEQTFWARLADCSDDNPDEIASFPFQEVSADDWPLILPGALFSWHIGREWRDRQVRRVSDIRFRRAFRFSPATVSQARERAAVLADLLAEATTYPAVDTTET